MKYTVTIGPRTCVIEIDGTSVRLDGRPVEVATHETGTPLRRHVIGGRSLEVTAVPGEEAGQWIVAAEGSRVTVNVLDERSQTIRAMAGAAAVPHGPVVVRAPMPGLVVRVLVQTGDVVPAGKGLVVVEAMKMENELKAPSAGIVERVHVTPGTPVEKGTLLVELAAPEQSSS